MEIVIEHIQSLPKLSGFVGSSELCAAFTGAEDSGGHISTITESEARAVGREIIAGLWHAFAAISKPRAAYSLLMWTGKFLLTT